MSLSKFPADSDWEQCKPLELVDTVTGIPACRSTEVRMGWNPEYLYIRYVCEDDHIVSDFTERDQPLYEQDVVELFIDEHGDGKQYMELEVSPRNIVFDAFIRHEGGASGITVDMSWSLKGILTAVEPDGCGNLVYSIHIPASNFESPLMEGTCWRANVYRIDEDMQGTREYQAWQPTGAVNFHLPDRFGFIQLV